jgi:hypothetical protein
MDLDKAMELAKNTDYAVEATHQDINPINMADAGAFFLEGYLKAMKDAMGVCDNAWNDRSSQTNMYNHAMGIKWVLKDLKESK